MKQITGMKRPGLGILLTIALLSLLTEPVKAVICKDIACRTSAAYRAAFGTSVTHDLDVYIQNHPRVQAGVQAVLALSEDKKNFILTAAEVIGQVVNPLSVSAVEATSLSSGILNTAVILTPIFIGLVFLGGGFIVYSFMKEIRAVPVAAPKQTKAAAASPGGAEETTAKDIPSDSIKLQQQQRQQQQQNQKPVNRKIATNGTR